MKPDECDYLIYTDGGCAFNPGGPGGYAAVIIDQSTGELVQLSGGFRSTTSNRMEIMGAIAALEWIPDGSSYFLYSDSRYMLNGMEGICSRKKNRDLFDRLDEAAKGKRGGSKWIPGHAGNEYNELCDAMCTEAMTQPDLPQDRGFSFRNGNRRKERELAQADSLNAMAVRIDLPAELSGIVRLTEDAPPEPEKGLNIECIDGIDNFYENSRRRFRDYANLHTGGIDCWSRKKQDFLLEGVQDSSRILEILQNLLPEEKDRGTALKWYRRGLTLTDSIRKVLVDREVSVNAAGRRKRRRRQIVSPSAHKK